ncbi:MAG: LPS export ABC transporter permease LptG [Zoogloeaceae bacterium]|nr:LPS export ABC transporter permease LptG [Zoogloeaceae bacterium]
MKVYRRYLAKEIYAAVALVLTAFLMLFAFFDFINELESLGKGGYQLQHMAMFVLLSLPGHVYELAPIAVLIGTLYALTMLARHSEMTVLRVSGLSTTAILGGLAGVGLSFVLMTFVVGDFVAPPAERAAKRLRLEAMAQVVGQEFRSGLWVKDGASFINVRTVLPDSRLEGVRIYEFDKQHVLHSISEAAEGEYLPPDKWHLKNVAQTVFGQEQTRVSHVAEAVWQSAINPEILGVLLVMPERMSVAGLYRYIQHLKDNQVKTQRYEIAMWKKLIYPLATLVMMALALPFAYLQDRMGAVSAKVFAGIMLGITFHMLNGLFSNLGIINSWPPFFSAITPSLLFLLTAVGMLWWTERR